MIFHTWYTLYLHYNVFEKCILTSTLGAMFRIRTFRWKGIPHLQEEKSKTHSTMHFSPQHYLNIMFNLLFALGQYLDSNCSQVTLPLRLLVNVNWQLLNISTIIAAQTKSFLAHKTFLAHLGDNLEVFCALSSAPTRRKYQNSL